MEKFTTFTAQVAPLDRPNVDTDAIITVGATDSGDNKTSWSNYGNYIDVAAPGAGIWTTTNGGGYGYSMGTSAAPEGFRFPHPTMPSSATASSAVVNRIAAFVVFFILFSSYLSLLSGLLVRESSICPVSFSLQRRRRNRPAP